MRPSCQRPVLTDAIRRHLESGFIVLTSNPTRQTSAEAFEAWAYDGPLDFDQASPVRFGLGQDPIDALDSLAHHLDLHRNTTISIEGRPGQVHPAVRRIHDLLYLDERNGRVYDPKKSWDATTLDMIAAVVAEYIRRPEKGDATGVDAAVQDRQDG